MQDIVKVDNIDSIRKRVLINVSANSVDKKFVEFFEDVKKEVELPGFRKGKAPISHIKKYFSEKAKPSVAQIILSEFYAKAIKEYDFSPVGNPNIEGYVHGETKYPGHFDYDNSYHVELVVETLPKIDPTGYKDIELNTPDFNYDSAINNKMLEYREKFAERIQVDRGAQLGDSLNIDLVGKLDGEDVPFPGGTILGFHLSKLGNTNLIPGLEEQMVGLKSGENKTLQVVFPEGYNAKHLAGKKANFDIKVNSVIENKLADENDDLAMISGYNNLVELKENIQKEVKQEIKDNQNRLFEHQITNKLLEKNSFEVPNFLVELEFQRLVKQIKQNKEAFTSEVLNAIKSTAKNNVMKAIIIDAIYDKEDGIEVSPDELDQMLDLHAKQNNTTKDELVSILYRSNQMDSFVGILRNKKVVEYIIEHAHKSKELSNG